MVASVFNDELIPQTIKDAARSIREFADSNDSDGLFQSALRIAEAFGRGDFFVYIKDCSSEIEKKLIKSFMKNIQLLVQKTWVEETEEEFKEETLYRINSLCEKLLSAENISIYKKLFGECFSILYDTVSLLFGNLVKTGNFLEYALRIEPDFGFFWYYINSISKLNNISEEKARCSVLLAMFFLANF